MTMRALLASTCLATALAAGASAYAQDDYYAPEVREIDAVYYVTWLEATVRDAPTSMALAITAVYMGERVNVTGIVDGTEWVRVGFDDGTIGYMWSGVLAPAMVGGSPAGATGGTDTGTEAAAADGAGNSIFDARELGPLDNADLTLDDYVGSDDLDDYYAFDVSGWTFIDLALEGLAADADLMLVDEYETIVGSSEAAGSASEYVQQIVPPGRYYIRVTSYEGNSDYTLYVYTEPTDPPPPDSVGNTMEDATAIDPPGEVPETYNERLDISDFDDWYAFTVEDFTEVSAALYGLQGDLDIEIVDADGNTLATGDNSGTADERVTAVVGPGTHFIHVYVYAGQSDYALEVIGVATEPPPPDGAGNSLEDANDLGTFDPAAPEGLSAGDWVGPGDLDDYFKFTVGEEQALEIRLEGLVGDLDLELLDDQGTIVSVSNNSGNAAEMIAVTVGAGTYYLHVYAFEGSSDFTLSVSAPAQP